MRCPYCNTSESAFGFGCVNIYCNRYSKPKEIKMAHGQEHADHCIPEKELDKIEADFQKQHHPDCSCKVCFEAKVRLRMEELRKGGTIT